MVCGNSHIQDWKLKKLVTTCGFDISMRGLSCGNHITQGFCNFPKLEIFFNYIFFLVNFIFPFFFGMVIYGNEYVLETFDWKKIKCSTRKNIYYTAFMQG